MSGEQIRLQVPPKLLEVTRWIAQMIRHTAGDQTVGPATENARVPKVLRQTRGSDSWWHLADRRWWRSETWETGTPHTIVGEVPWSSVAKTTMDCHSKLVLDWWSGVVVSTLALVHEVNLRRPRLVLRWVTVSGSIPGAGHLFQYVTNQPPKANSAFHPSGVGKWAPASAGKAKAGMVHSVSGWTRGVQVKKWDPLRPRAIP